MWESPEELWRRLKLGREEFLQRVVTTLIVGGDPPSWNTPRTPSVQGRQFLALLDDLAHGTGAQNTARVPESFVDEYLLPKLDDSAANGWPDWAVLWPNRAWIIELKTEAGSHRDDQLPYYLRLSAAAHPDCQIDLTYITGPLSKPDPALARGQRYSHLTWDQVLPLIEATWGADKRPEVAAYVAMTRTVITNLGVLRPSEQRGRVLDPAVESPAESASAHVGASPASADSGLDAEAILSTASAQVDLVELARLTAADGRQRAVGATDPTQLETLRDAARAAIDVQPANDVTRFVLPWLWKREGTGGQALTAEGGEFGYELRFSRYKQMQVKT